MGKMILDTRRPKKIYAWHPKTNEFFCEGEAIPDPNDVNNWLIPSNATIIEPPKEKEGYVVKWNGEKWVSSKA